MARTRGQNNIAKPIQRFSPSSSTHARKKTKAEPPAPSAAAQGSTSDTKSKQDDKSTKKKETVTAQAEAGPEEEQDAAGGGPVVSAIRDERDAPESLPKKTKSTKARGKCQKANVELAKGPAEAHPVEGASEASSSGAVEHAADEEENEHASSGSETKGKPKLSPKASRKPATPRKRVTRTPKKTRAKAEKDEAHEGDDRAEPSASKHEANPNTTSQGPREATKPRDRAAKSSASTQYEVNDIEAGDMNDEPEPSGAKAETAEAKPNSLSKGAAKSTRTKKKTNQLSSPAEKGIVEEKDNEPGPSISKGRSVSKSASQTSSTQTKRSKKVTKPEAAGSKAAQNATEGEDSEAEPSGSTTGSISKTSPKVTRSKKSANNNNRAKAPPVSTSKTAIAKGRKERKVPAVDDTQYEKAGPGEEDQDEPLDDSNSEVKKARRQTTTSKATGSKRSADKTNSKEPSPKYTDEPTTAGNRKKSESPSVGDTKDGTAPTQGQHDEAPDNRNSRSKRSRQKAAAPTSAATKLVAKSGAPAQTSTPDNVDNPREVQPKRGRGRPPKGREKPAADPGGGDGTSAAAKGSGKGRRKPADTTYRHSAEDQDEDDDRLGGDAKDHEEETGSPKKRRRVQDPTYRPDPDAWSEPSPLSEHKAGVHPVRNRESKDKERNGPVGYANNLLPPSERAVHLSPDFDERGKLGWRSSSRKKREGPGARRREMTKAAQAKKAQAEPRDNDDLPDDAERAQPSAPEGDQQHDAHGSQTPGSEPGEAEYRSDRIANLRANRLGGGDSRSSTGPSSRTDTTPQPSKRKGPVSQTDRTAQTLPPRRPADRHFRSQAGPAPQPSGIRGISGLSIPSVQPNTLKRTRKTVGELQKEERQRKRDAKRRRTEDRDSASEEPSSQHHPTVSFEDPTPGSQEGEAPQQRGHKRRHSSTVFASITNTHRTHSWPDGDHPASRRDLAETDNPPLPGKSRKKPYSEPGTSVSRLRAVAIPSVSIGDDTWSEVLRSSSSGSNLSAAAHPRPREDSFFDTTITTAFNMFYRIYHIPWGWGTKTWRDEQARIRAAEKKTEREAARKAARTENGSRNGKARVRKSPRSKKPAATKNGKGKQKETTPESEALEDLEQEEEDDEQEQEQEEGEKEEEEREGAAGQELEERTGGSMNTRKDSHENVLTITQTTTVKTPERRSRSAIDSVSPQTRQAASILGGLGHRTAGVGNPQRTSPLRRHGGPGGTDPSPRTMQLAQELEYLRQSSDGLQARNDGGWQPSREAPLRRSDFDIGGEERPSPGEAPEEATEEALREAEVEGLTEDQGTTEDEGREVQTPREGDEVPLIRGGMFRMAQRLIGKSSD